MLLEILYLLLEIALPSVITDDPQLIFHPLVLDLH